MFVKQIFQHRQNHLSKARNERTLITRLPCLLILWARCVSHHLATLGSTEYLKFEHHPVISN